MASFSLGTVDEFSTIVDSQLSQFESPVSLSWTDPNNNISFIYDILHLKWVIS